MKKKAGFSLVELIIVIAIMAALVAILAPQYTKYVGRSREVVCRNNLEEAVKAYRVERIENANPSLALKDAMDEIGAKEDPAHAWQYTNMCPVNGTVSCELGLDGSLTITCSKHGSASAADYAATLTNTIFNTENPIKRPNGDKDQTLMEYLNRDGVNPVDSEAPEKNGSQKTFTGLIKTALQNSGSSMLNQSWVLRREGTHYVIYITTGGKITDNALRGTSVPVLKYTYDADGKQVGSAESTTALVQKHNEYSYNLLKP